MGVLQCSWPINTLVQVYVPFKRLLKRKADCTAREKPRHYFPTATGFWLAVLFWGYAFYIDQTTSPEPTAEITSSE